ncbi:unnamed protein product [Dibothriocephalus latus]|uniref:Dynamin-type G domain-containing protein n=1 Tax=Dibothriocephalus latus TaxID=60516 RepID=A0A3P7MAL7_DIBLA|nr:unnamed protein product [Dibothriocephalus latus]
MADQLIAGNPGVRSRNLLLRTQSHSNLIKFKEAKQELQNIFSEIEGYVKECQKFFEEKLPADAGKRLSPALGRRSEEDLKPYYDRVKQIQEIIARNQMKCAFFGRTSNGKSTVINAMLGSRILPAGIGHTTSCFVQIEGTDKSQGFTRLVNSATTEDGSSPRPETDQPIESVSQLAHALSSDKLATDSLICLYWPNANCHLLREDVVLLDSPGVNVDPDMDRWIDQHCLDADVFILVANAESTLMQAVSAASTPFFCPFVSPEGIIPSSSSVVLYFSSTLFLFLTSVHFPLSIRPPTFSSISSFPFSSLSLFSSHWSCPFPTLVL